MSIVMNLYYTGDHGSARKFAEEMERGGTAGLIRGEAGNMRYEYFISLKDPETVLLIDIWRDQAAIDLHRSSPMMEKILQLRKKYGLQVKAERYTADENGIPDADAKFIER